MLDSGKIFLNFNIKPTSHLICPIIKLFLSCIYDIYVQIIHCFLSCLFILFPTFSEVAELFISCLHVYFVFNSSQEVVT